jgi:hypothetical protein
VEKKEEISTGRGEIDGVNANATHTGKLKSLSTPTTTIRIALVLCMNQTQKHSNTASPLKIRQALAGKIEKNIPPPPRTFILDTRIEEGAKRGKPSNNNLQKRSSRTSTLGSRTVEKKEEISTGRGEIDGVNANATHTGKLKSLSTPTTTIHIALVLCMNQTQKHSNTASPLKIRKALAGKIEKNIPPPPRTFIFDQPSVCEACKSLRL